MRKLLQTVLITMCAILPLASKATGMPVFDAGSFAELVAETAALGNQLKALKKAYGQATEQLGQAKQLVHNSTGNYGWGKFGNSDQDLKKREWSPDNWQSALKGLSGGNPDRYKELLNEYKKNHPVLAENDYKKGAQGASDANYNIYKSQIAINRAAAVNATYAFNSIKEHLENLHKLSAQIDSKSKNKNTKSALDLVARIITEQAYISIQELKMQALLNQQMACRGASVIAAETEAAKFNRLPDK